WIVCDKSSVSLFSEHASRILDAAETAAARGEACSELSILIGPEGGLHIISESDWPLDSLAWHHGARMAYRVSQRDGAVRVEGRDGSRTCLLESESAAKTARLMLGTART